MLCQPGRAQTEADYEEYGQLVFSKLTVDSLYNTVDFFWLSDYRNYIDAQDLTASQKERLIHEINTYYEEWYVQYQRSVEYLRQYYFDARAKGATLEYLETDFTLLDRYDDLYEVTVSFIYSTEKVQNQVDIHFQAVWYHHFFWLITPFEERF